MALEQNNLNNQSQHLEEVNKKYGHALERNYDLP